MQCLPTMLTEKMQTVTFLLVLFTFQVQASPFNDSSSRIYHGQLAGEHEFPWAIRLVTHLPKYVGGLCSASLASPSYVITAGHCIFDNDTKKTYPADKVEGWIGNADASEARKIKFQKIWLHPSYNINIVTGDFAVLMTTLPVELGAPSVGTICIASSQFPLDSLDQVTSAGWGLHAAGEVDNLLRKTNSKFLTPEECKKKTKYSYPEMVRCIDSETKNQLCGGDSGGPLMGKVDGKYILLAVASLSSEAFCRHPSHLSMVTLVGYYQEWIKGIIADEKLCVASF